MTPAHTLLDIYRRQAARMGLTDAGWRAVLVEAGVNGEATYRDIAHVERVLDRLITGADIAVFNRRGAGIQAGADGLSARDLG